MNFEYYKPARIADGVTRIRCAAGEICYLIEGEKRAALIDSGSGYRGLSELTRAITPLETSVILTHGHRDHAGGIVQFKTAYASPDDAELLSKINDEEFRHGYPAYVKPAEFKNAPADVFPRLFEPNIIAVKDGDIIDLGGTELEIWAAPGHTRGSVCVYDKRRRLLFSGDTVIDCALLVFEQSDTVSRYLQSLETIKSRESMYDAVYSAHFGGDVPAGGIDSLIDCCRDILNGADEKVPSRMFLPCFAARKPGTVTTRRADGKWGNVFYK